MEQPITLPPSWREPLEGQFSASLSNWLQAESMAGKRIFPTTDNWFRAFDLTPLDRVRVVILGQDPYHGPDQAHGLSFSVLPGTKLPPSLGNIYKELEADLGIRPAAHGFLEHWAKQGVLLLNTVLTVEMGRAHSHKGRGWEQFTDEAIRAVNAKSDPVVFMLWGGPAQEKAPMINASRHLVLEAPHPSPLSAYRGFLGCRHFSKANAFLKGNEREPIDWALPEI